ncbi:hypothetical protein [Desulforhopalus singaporensis]|uniref:Uncharacterized protein n=1 Tax=Desulforhopalus singaporensis TaxID=91360 RepID=A0A1H0UHK8_9BACT|nr:hypothetical protein [Desulforhopalus singaporensis]SDP65478.1 hypothetical protein SAMN05660330_03553 [Desulforhopalus singaporensis]
MKTILAPALAPLPETSGYCPHCNKTHRLGSGRGYEIARRLIQWLTGSRTIALYARNDRGQTTPEDPTLATDYLWGAARGKMFGVMECLRPDGSVLTLYAFSGQYNGRWLVDGWVPPLFDVDEFITVTGDTEKEIKRLTEELAAYGKGHPEKTILRQRRRLLSKELTAKIHNLYRLHNFNGQSASLPEAFTGSGGIPTGTGDCCAPKLLDYAARNNLQPLGMAEFYIGRATKSGSYRHGDFSAPCAKRCSPILGFLLCGLADN